MVQTSRLVLEIDSRDAKQEAADTRKALEALENAGLRVKPAMDKAGDGMSGMSVDSDKATKSIKQQRAELEQLLGSLDPVRKKQTELAKAQSELAAAFSRGDLNQASYKQFSGIIRDQVTTLNQSKAAINDFNTGLARTGMSAKATAAAMRGVPAQITDIVVSLQGGQAPLTVLLQQGGQLKDMFGGVVPAAKALGSSVVALINPFTIAAAATAALGAAYYKGWSEADNYRKALLLTGNAAGLSSSQLSDMASTIGDSVGTTSSAAAALASLASSGKIATGSFEAVTTAALKLKENTGRAVEDTVAEFVKIGEDPVAAAKSLNDQYNFLTVSVYEQIKSLQDQGDTVGAVNLLTNTYANTISGRTGEMTQNLGYIEQAWRNIKNVSAEALSAAASIGREQTLSQQRVDLQAKLNDLEEKSKNTLVARSGFVTKERDALQAQLNIIDLQIDGEKSRSKYLGDSARIQREGIDAASRRLKIEEEGQTKAQKLNKALEKANTDINKERAAGSKISAEQEEALYKTIRERSEFQEKAAQKEKAYTEDSGMRALDLARQQYAVLMEQSSLIDEQRTGTKALGDASRELIKWEQELADIKGKQTLTAAQKSLLASQDLITAQLKRNAGLEKENELRKIANAEAAKLLTFTESINDKLALSQQGLSNQLAGIGLGQEGRKRLQDDLKIRQDYQKDMDKLQAQFNSGDLSEELYEKETAMLEDALGQRLRMQEDYYTQLEQAQSDWTNGANAAWQDYVYEAGDIAGQTYDLFDNAFHGMEDSLVDFVTGGKLSFKDLADSIIADIARIIIKTQVVTPLLNSLFGGGAGAGGGGGIASMFGSGGAGGSGGMSLESAWNGVSGAYSLATSEFGTAVGAGWNAGEGFLGGVQGAFKAGAGTISAGIGNLFGQGAGTMVNGVYQLSASAAPATVDLIANTVTNSSTGAVTGTATGATTAASAGLSASSAVMYGIGGAIQGYLKAGVKGAVAGAGGAVAGAYAGAAIGSAIPVIGTAIGAAIGAVLGGMFGSSLFGSDWITKDEGFQLGVSNGELDSSSFEYQKKKGGLFSSNKKRTRLSAMDPEMQEALDKTYAVTLGSVIGLFDSLDVELNDAVLDGLNVAATQISTRDKTAEQIQEELAKWFTGLGDAAVAEVNKVTGSGLDGFNLEGLTTFVNNLYSVNTSFDMIGVKMVDFNIAGGRAVENLVALAGGIEALNQNMTKFYDGFTTDTQKSIDVLDGVRAQFKAMGLTLPDTREAFAEAVKGLDMTSQAEREIFNSMTANSEQAAAAYTILEQRQAAYYAGFYSESENTARSIGELTDSLKAAGIALPAARSGFRELVEAASKDTTEAGKKMYETLMNLSATADSAYDLMDARGQALSDSLMGGVSNAMSAVQRAVDSEKNSITAAYNAQVASLNAASSTLGSSISSLTSIGSSLESALKSLNGTSDEAVKMLYAQARAVLDNALATARAGGSLDGFAGLNDALDTVSSNDTDLYSSLQEFNRDQGRAANVIAELNAINGVQLSTQEKTLRSIEDQLEISKRAYDAQIKSLDDQVLQAQAQIDALNGVDTSIMSVTAAVNAMNAAVVAALSARPAGAAAGNTPGNNSTLLDTVYQQILGRDTDTAGAAYWGGLLQSGAIDYAGLVAAITKDAKANGEIPAFANGGFHSGGIRLVGEKGPEIEATGAARYYSASKTTAMLNGASSSASSAEMVERQSWTNRLLNQLIKAVNKQTNIGMPVWQVNQ